MRGHTRSRRSIARLGGLLSGCGLIAVTAMIGVAGTPGIVGDTTADVALGQTDFVHNMVNFGSLNALNSPGGVAIDANGHLYVADVGNNRVLGFPSAAAIADGASAAIVIGQPDPFSYACTTTAAGLCLSGPTCIASNKNVAGVAVDGSGNLYVADACNNRVLEFNAPFNSNGVVQGEAASLVFGQGGSFTDNVCASDPNGLCVPTGVAVDSTGNVFVADMGNNRVLEYDQPLVSPGVCSPGSPDAAGRGCTGDTNADLVFGQSDLIDADGSPGYQLCNDGLYPGDDDGDHPLGLGPDSLCAPSGVAVDGAGNLYVADTTNARVLEYNAPFATGPFPIGPVANLVFGPTNFFTVGTCSTGLCGPTGVAVDSSGNLYVADLAGSVTQPPGSDVVEYSPPFIVAPRIDVVPIPTTGNVAARSFGLLNTYGNPDDNPPFRAAICNGDQIALSAGSLCAPAGVAVDPAGDLFVADTSNNRVLEYFTPSSSTSVSGSGDNVADLALGQIDLLHNIANFGGLTAVNAPGGVVTDAAGHAYVADINNNRVLGWSSIAAQGAGLPADIVIGQSDFYSYLCDVQYATYSPQATTLCFSDQGVTGGGITVDVAGNLWIADFGNNRVLEFDQPFASGITEGQRASLVIGQRGVFYTGYCVGGPVQLDAGDDGLCGPRSVVLDPAGNLYVADTANNRVVEYNTPIAQAARGEDYSIADMVFGQPNLSTKECADGLISTDISGVGPDSLCAPSGLALDSANNLYVADTGDNRVVEYNTPLSVTQTAGSGDNVADLVLGQSGDFTQNGCNLGAGGLCGPSGVTFDSFANLYVADAGDNRVVAYSDPIATPVGNPLGATLVFGQNGSFFGNQCGNGGITETTPPVPAFAIPGTLMGVPLGMVATPTPTPTPSGNALDARVGSAAAMADHDAIADAQATPSQLSADSLCDPAGVAVDSSNNLYIADAGNNRVLKFDQPVVPTPGTPTPNPTPTLAPGQTAVPTSTPTPSGPTPTPTPTPIAQPLTITPKSLHLDFGKVALKKTSKPKMVTITNVVIKKKTGLTVTIMNEVSSFAAFAVTSQCAQTLAPGKSCKVSVTFNPQSTGLQTGSLTIFTNSEGFPRSVNLSGTGMAHGK
jgi:sugar lactone lactonase YvrE